MEELRGCKRAVSKALPNAPNVRVLGSVIILFLRILNVASSSNNWNPNKDLLLHKHIEKKVF